MSDPVTTALALQMEYGDEDLKRDIDKRIEDIAKQVVMDITHDSQFMDRLIVNNAFMFNKAVARAMREHMNNTASY
jgi:hypothetical protein